MPYEHLPEHLYRAPTLGDLNQTTALILAELQMQNELLYAAANKKAVFKPIPDTRTITSLFRFFRAVLDDPACRWEPKYEFPLQNFVRADGTDDYTFLENLEEANRVLGEV